MSEAKVDLEVLISFTLKFSWVTLFGHTTGIQHNRFVTSCCKKQFFQLTSKQVKIGLKINKEKDKKKQVTST